MNCFILSYLRKARFYSRECNSPVQRQRVRVNFLRRAEDGKQGSVSRDEKQTGDKNQAKWRREWKKGGQARVVGKKAEQTFGKRKAKSSMLEPTEQQQLLDEKRPDHRRVVFVGGVDGCSVDPTSLPSDRDIRLCVRPAWDSHALVPNACLPL